MRLNGFRVLPAALLFALILGSASARPLGAQTVRVHVADRDSRAPITGAIVSVVDSRGTRLAASLTDATGSADVRIDAASGTSLRVQAQRVGYATATLDVVADPTAAPRTIELVLEQRALVLGAVAVGEKSRCEVNPAEGTVAAVLWDEVRKALTASVLTARTSPSLATTRYARTLDPALRVVAETTKARTVGPGAGFRSADPELLSREGFIRPVAGAEEYYAPDAELLLSPAFARDHCFGVTAPANMGPVIGLRFAPAAGRRVPEVSGVLWLDRRTSELRWLEYSYANVPADRDIGAAGGRVEFAALPGGQWITQQWYIRVPRLARLPRSGGGRFTIAARDTLVGYVETGGMVTLAAPAGGPALGGGIAVLTGTVFDSTRGRPLAGVRVTLGSGGAETVTDSGGRYRLESRLAGRYVVQFAHPRLALLGVAPLSREAALDLGTISTLDLTAPSAASVHARICDAAGGPRRGLLFAQVIDSVTSAPLSGARVAVTWRKARLVGTGLAPIDSVLEVESDSVGGAVLCDIPSDLPLSLRVTRGGRRSDRKNLRADTLGLGELTIALGPSSARVLTLSGRVRTGKGSDARPLAGAEVLVPSLDRTTRTDIDGRFTFGEVGEGGYAVIVRSVGYAPVVRQVSLSATSDTSVDVVLEPIAVELARTLVTASSPTSGRMRGFEERRATGAGHFITSAELRKQEDSQLSTILERISGTKIIRYANGAYLGNSRGVSSLASQQKIGRSGPSACWAQVFLDGVRIFAPSLQDPNSGPPPPPPDLNQFAGRHFEAIEFYTPATTPSQFNGSAAGCGTLVLWTREG